MRWTLLLLLLPSLALAAQKTEVEGGKYAAADGALVKTWDCADTRIDLRKKGDGVVACLESVTVDTATGASVVQVGVDVAGDEPAVWKLVIVSEDAERVLVDHERVEDGGLKLLFPFATWDPSEEIERIVLRTRGGGAPTAAARWDVDTGLDWRGDWAPRQRAVWIPHSEPSCRYWDVRKKHFDDVEDELSDGAKEVPIRLRFDAVVKGDSEFGLEFEAHGVEVQFEDGTLEVHGRETLKREIDGWSTDADRPNPVEILYDGDHVTVRVHGVAYGPIAGKKKEGKPGRFGWDLDAEDANVRLRDLRVASCTQPDPERWAAPPEEVARSAPPPASDEGVPPPPLGDVPPPSGAVLAAIIPPKREVTPGEVAMKGMQVAQGVQQTAGALQQAGEDWDNNLDAAKKGDYGRMKSTKTTVNIGSDGVSASHSSASLTGSGTKTGVQMQHQSGSAQWGTTPSDRQDVISAVRAAGIDPGAVCLVQILARDYPVDITVNDADVLRLRMVDDLVILALADGDRTIGIGPERRRVRCAAGVKAAF